MRKKSTEKTNRKKKNIISISVDDAPDEDAPDEHSDDDEHRDGPPSKKIFFFDFSIFCTFLAQKQAVICIF